MRTRKPELRNLRPGEKKKREDYRGRSSVLFIPCVVFCFLLTIHCFLSTGRAFSQDDMMGPMEKKQKEIKEREEALKKEEERLAILKKEVEDKIDKYTKL
ncbi:MAG TPA: hypothetical protein DCP92_11385, partial [Nitrospiraceae bacterium]|nr:hypothetical protein [Nitrospiraceae bacterium]